MELGFRGAMGANGLAAPGNLVSPTMPQSDIRSDPGNNRPMTASDISSSGSVGNCQADKLQPVIRKRRGGSRRACNECKQQKLRCDIVHVPSSTCSRCRRLGIDCKVEPTFKRISKRRRNAEMEREIADLRQRLETGEHRPQPSFEINPAERIDQPSEVIFRGTASPSTRVPPLHASVKTQQSLQTPLSLRATEPPILLDDDNAWSLEEITISKTTVARLFEQYFRYYHPFLPLLDPMKGADEYMRSSVLLAWTIIFVASRRAPSEPGLLASLTQPFSRLLWSTITTVPQNYHVVKALCLLCTWPLPTTSQRSDPTFMLSGLMMQVAMQLGLHRPVQAEEFTTFRIEVRGEELKDRLQTWIICNIVAQHVATGYGQPPGTIYDWAIEPASLKVADYRIPEEIRIRLRIEKFCDRVTKGLYSSKPDPADFATAEKLLIVRILEGELKEMELEFGQDISQINMIHLRAADLHLRYFVFLGTNARIEDLTNLFIATTSFLGRVLDLETSPGNLLSHATNYILQMVVSAAFALMKLLKSSFSRQIDLDHGKFLFNGAISAIRRISVMDHDRPVRLADVLSQMWNASGSGSATGDDALQLKVRCRMSMSHVYDTVWRWRQRFRPTKPTDDTQASSVSNQNPELSASGPVTQPQDNSLNDPTLFLSPFDHNGGIISEASFSDVFDSLNWVFDGIPDSFGGAPAV